MSLISCTNNCVYQEEGCCTLERTVSSGQPSNRASCIHFIPKHSSTAGMHPAPLVNSSQESSSAQPGPPQTHHPGREPNKIQTPNV